MKDPDPKIVPDPEHWVIVHFRFQIKIFFCENLEIWWDFLPKFLTFY